MVVIRLLFVGLVLIVGHGCSTVPVEPVPEATVEEPPSRPILPGPAAPVTESSAVRSVIDDCWEHMDSGRWADAIAAAERGLRIERRSAELYLVLARAYSAMQDPDQAQAFARQGLRYSDRAPVAIGEQLRSVLGGE